MSLINFLFFLIYFYLNLETQNNFIGNTFMTLHKDITSITQGIILDQKKKKQKMRRVEILGNTLGHHMVNRLIQVKDHDNLQLRAKQISMNKGRLENKVDERF